MREDTPQPPSQGQNDLVDQLRSLSGPNSASTLAELAYRRAKEALERALDEAREIRIKAFQEARETRERELAQTLESLKAMRESAERQVESVLAIADTLAAQARSRAHAEADATIAAARAEAEQVRAEAASVRAAADERAREVQRLQDDFDAVITRLTERIGLKRREPWLSRLGNKH